MDVLESKYSVLVLSHNNCEIHCCHLDGYKENTNAFLRRMLIIEDEFSSKPAHSRYRIWYNLDDNKLDKDVMKYLTESILRLQGHIYKIAFIGLRGIYKWKFENMLKHMLAEQTVIRAYFLDAEQAKGWLV